VRERERENNTKKGEERQQKLDRVDRLL